MLHYPSLNPLAFSVGALKIHWYGIMYLLSFILGWIFIRSRVRQLENPWPNDQIVDFILYLALGVILGGRLGYMIFYNAKDFISHPWIVVKIWEGGMSFHGGLLGVILALYLWSRHTQQKFVELSDLIAPIIPVGLAAGRLGNFIQGELWGRVTTVPWGIVYDHVDSLPRHPSPLYEFFFEGIVLFIVLWIYTRKPRPVGSVSALFLMGYGMARIFCEFFREPDGQYGYLAWNWLTMGQVLSIPLVLIGLIWFLRSE